MTTIVLNDPAPVYGDTISFTVTTDAARTGVKVTFTHAGGSSYSSVEYHDAGTYEKSVGCYAPNWPAGPAHGKADVIQVVRKKRPVLASVEFEVAG